MEKWNGFDCENFVFEGHAATIVFPEEGKASGGLALKTEYQHHFPEAAEIPLLKLGYHVCFVENDNRFGRPEDLDRKARFVRFVQEKCGLRKKCVPVGFSCGGMIALYFAERYPELVSCLYVDAPVVNFMSWPCHFGKETITPPHLNEILTSLRLKNLAELMAYREMPLDKLPSLIEKKIPLVMASGDSDTVVPYHENGFFVEQAYKNAALPIEVYIKPGGDHHPHGIPDPTPVVDFILRHDHD